MNRLLAYISLKGSGKMADFASACRALNIAVRPWDCLQAMSNLGHVEYSWLEAGWWSCAPSVVALLPGEEPVAVACGARGEDLAQGLVSCGLELAKVAQSGGPDVWLVQGKSKEQILQSAKQIGVACPEEPPAWGLAKCLPQLDAYIRMMSREVPFPPASDPFLWNAKLGNFESRPSIDGDGLWRFEDRRRGGRKTFVLVHDHQVWQTGDYEAVKLSVRIQGPPLAAYDPKSREFRWHSGQPLPRLHARVLVLCSGRLPDAEPGGWICFHNVPPEIAALICARLAITAQEVVAHD